MATTTKPSEIRYDEWYGHVCSCAERDAGRDAEGFPNPPAYDHTVSVDRSIEPTDTGSWYYRCSRCGAGGWSGC